MLYIRQKVPYHVGEMLCVGCPSLCFLFIWIFKIYFSFGYHLFVTFDLKHFTSSLSIYKDEGAYKNISNA